MKKHHHNIPFFVPHAGCPCLCVYCSQGKITGKGVAERSLDGEIAELRALLDAATPSTDDQLAFFGGSFTAIEHSRRLALLSVANEYIHKGVIGSIRLSTRPDCIDGEILDELHAFGVTSVELGVQSVSDRVLSLSGRGCDAKACTDGCRAVADDGRFTLCGQMMIGLPGSSMEAELDTARAIVDCGAKEARIYPTAVFEDTELYDMTLRGEYIPLTLEEAVERSAACAEVFIDSGVTLLRTGLHSGPELSVAPFGANHPAIGELVMGRVYRNRIERLMPPDVCGRETVISVPRGDISKLTGHGAGVIEYIKNKYHLSKVKVSEADLPYMTPTVEVKE